MQTLFKLFTRSKKETESQDLAATGNPYRDLHDLKMFGGARGLPAYFNMGNVPVLKDVIFPNVLITDIWEKQGLNKAIEDLSKGLGGKHFNVCPLRDFEKIYQLHPDASQQLSYRNLNMIHCMDYVKMERKAIDGIVGELNNYFRAKSTHPGARALPEQFKELT